MRQKFTELGATVRPSTAEEFAAFQKTDEAALADLAAKGVAQAAIVGAAVVARAQPAAGTGRTPERVPEGPPNRIWTMPATMPRETPKRQARS